MRKSKWGGVKKRRDQRRKSWSVTHFWYQGGKSSLMKCPYKIVSVDGSRMRQQPHKEQTEESTKSDKGNVLKTMAVTTKKMARCFRRYTTSLFGL